MYVKLPPKDLNSGFYPPYPTNTYTYEVTIAPRIYSDISRFYIGIKCNQFIK